MQWERKFRVLLGLNFCVYFRNRSFVWTVNVSSWCGSRSLPFLTRSSSHHPSCHVLSRNQTPTFGDQLLYMLQFWNHSVCPVFIWVHFAWVHCFITSNTHLHLSLLFLRAQLPFCHAVHRHRTSVQSVTIRRSQNVVYLFPCTTTCLVISVLILCEFLWNVFEERIITSIIASGLITCHTPRKLSHLRNSTARWHFCWKMPEVFGCVAF